MRGSSREIGLAKIFILRYLRRTQRLRPFGGAVNKDVGRGIREVLGAEAESTADGPGSGVAGCFDVHFAVADHHGLARSSTGLVHERAETQRIRFLEGETVTAVNVEEVIGEAQPFADAARWTHRLVGEHSHGSLRGRRARHAARAMP